MQAAEAPARTCPRNSRSYIWQPGDTLFSVAAANATTPGLLAQTNPDVDFDHIGPGTLVCVPLGAGQDGPVLDGTGSDTGVVTPGFDGPVLDGTGSDTGVVTPSPSLPVVPVRPVLACPIGYSPYTVRPGQTYADILVDLNVSYHALRATNPGLNPAFLVAGTRFCAPPAGTRQVCARAAYTIQPGETLASIAARLRTTQGRLLMLNPDLIPTDFTAGTVICVP